MVNAGKVTKDDVILQFGRVNDNMFNMDVKYPMSIMQAFTMCLSTFEYKC